MSGWADVFVDQNAGKLLKVFKDHGVAVVENY
jgi:hypothetical protein